jgi:intracellular sulfur oxidation DsrE/DsrF family protein
MLRRSFFGIPAFALLQSPGAAITTTRAPGAWQPARHAEDDWLDGNTAKHRVILDTWNPEHFPDALQFAGNIVETNKTDYDIPATELAVVICVRHRTTPFAFNDAMWAKYGKAFSTQMAWTDPNAKDAPAANPYTRRLVALAAQGVTLAICNRTTRAYSANAARQAGADADAVRKEMTANAVIGGHFVPAGVIAVTRAQERGYANISIG